MYENVVKVLGLPVIRQGTFNLHTFGSPDPTIVKRNIVKLSLENLWNQREGVESHDPSSMHSLQLQLHLNLHLADALSKVTNI